MSGLQPSGSGSSSLFSGDELNSSSEGENSGSVIITDSQSHGPTTEQNDTSTNLQLGVGNNDFTDTTNSGTELGNGGNFGSGGINNNLHNETNQIGDEFLPLINSNITDGSALGNSPSSSSNAAAGESGNQIITDSSSPGRWKEII